MSDFKRRKLLGDILLKAGMIYEQQLLSALKEQKFTKMRFGEILIKNGWISDDELAQALSEQLSLPLVDLRRCTPDVDALSKVPRSLAERLEIIPLSVTGEGFLKIATSEPTDLLSVDELHQYTGLEIAMVLAPASRIRNEMQRFYEYLKSGEERQNITIQSVLLGTILFREGLIDENQIQAVLEEQKESGQRFGEILLKNGWVTESELTRALSVQLGIPLILLDDYPPDPKALSLVPRLVAERLQCLPLSVDGDRIIRIVVSEPLNVLAADELREVTEHQLEVYIGVPSEIRNAIPEYYQVLNRLSAGEVYKHTLLGQVLVNAGMINYDQLEMVLEQQKDRDSRIGEILLEKGWLDEKQLTEAISRQMQIPLILLASYTPDPSVLKLIPRKTAEKYQVLPLKLKNDGTLLMATAEPLTLDKIHELEGISNRKIEFRIARASSMKKEINRFYSSIIFLD